MKDREFIDCVIVSFSRRALVHRRFCTRKCIPVIDIQTFQSTVTCKLKLETGMKALQMTAVQCCFN
jgi:hypothetical protein